MPNIIDISPALFEKLNHKALESQLGLTMPVPYTGIRQRPQDQSNTSRIANGV